MYQGFKPLSYRERRHDADPKGFIPENQPTPDLLQVAERAAAPVLSQRHQSVSLERARDSRRGTDLEQQATQEVGLEDSGRGAQ
jgi:hypothetical protein